MGVLSDEDLLAMRARARHRLFGALGLVLILVVAVPLVFDRHETTPGTDEADAGHGAEPARKVPAQPSSVSLPGHPLSAADGSQPAPAKPVEPPHQAAADAPPAAPERMTGDAAPASTAVRPAEPARPAVAPPLPVPATIPPLEAATSPGRHDHAAGGADGTEGLAGHPASAHAHAHAHAGSDHAGSDHAAETEGAHGWFVQFGMFAEAARAQNLARHLESEGLKVHVQAIHGPRGAFTQVRAGPFATRAAADEVLARARGLGENAFLGHQ